MNRRGFMQLASGVVVAPWIVKTENIMKVRPLVKARRSTLSIDEGSADGDMIVVGVYRKPGELTQVILQSVIRQPTPREVIERYPVSIMQISVRVSPYADVELGDRIPVRKDGIIIVPGTHPDHTYSWRKAPCPASIET